MLATFCVRLVLGLVATLLILSPQQLHPRFFRTHFLTALGLLIVGLGFSWSEVEVWRRLALVVAAVSALLGALSWTLEPPPAGRLLIIATVLASAVALWPRGEVTTPAETMPPSQSALRFTDGLTSAVFLGSALSAMLIGHSYLISPGMSLSPLMRLMALLFAGIVARAAVAGTGFAWWTVERGPYTLDSEIGLWLPVRWLVGVAAPLGFAWMAYAAARIRSTQSATGILYVVVVCGFLGELVSLLMAWQTGLPL